MYTGTSKRENERERDRVDREIHGRTVLLLREKVEQKDRII